MLCDSEFFAQFKINFVLFHWVKYVNCFVEVLLLFQIDFELILVLKEFFVIDFSNSLKKSRTFNDVKLNFYALIVEFITINKLKRRYYVNFRTCIEINAKEPLRPFKNINFLPQKLKKPSNSPSNDKCCTNTLEIDS